MKKTLISDFIPSLDYTSIINRGLGSEGTPEVTPTALANFINIQR